jgi:hypothetical protein
MCCTNRGSRSQSMRTRGAIGRCCPKRYIAGSLPVLSRKTLQRRPEMRKWRMISVRTGREKPSLTKQREIARPKTELLLRTIWPHKFTKVSGGEVESAPSPSSLPRRRFSCRSAELSRNIASKAGNQKHRERPDRYRSRILTQSSRYNV